MSGNATKSILFVTHWARRLGGAELSLLDILASAGVRAHCMLSASEDGALIARARMLGVNVYITHCPAPLAGLRRSGLIVHILTHLPAMLSYAAYVRRLAKLILSVKPDLIHANVPKSHIALLILQTLGYRGPVCYHIREIFEQGSFARALYALLYRREKARVIAISEAVRQALPGRMRPEAAMIYNGVSVCPRRGNPPPEPLRLVYLGRVVPWKGCRTLLDIAALTRRRFGNRFTLHIIGDTLYWSQGYREQLRIAIDELNLGEQCRLLPHTSSPAEMLSRYHVFCNASRNEPFGRSLAEAQACGLPVIAFAGGGVNEIIDNGKTGFLVHQRSIADFADKIGLFLRDSRLIRTMGDAGAVRAEKLFARDRQMTAIIDYLIAIREKTEKV